MFKLEYASAEALSGRSFDSFIIWNKNTRIWNPNLKDVNSVEYSSYETGPILEEK